MAREIQLVYDTGATLYAIILSQTAQALIVATGLFEDPDETNWADYDLPLAEIDTSGIYTADVPAALAAGRYTWVLYEQAGASPAATDDCIGTEAVTWTGEAAAPSADGGSLQSLAGRTSNIEADTQDLQTQVGIDGAGLTALGDARIANLDATVSSRAAATVVAGITSLANWLRAMVRKDAANATAKSEINSGGGAYNEATDSQEGIRDTAPLGTAMRGTDSAALASVCTELRLAELDQANLPADVAALPTAGENADAVWDEALAGHAGAGSTGEALSAAGGAADPLLNAVPGAYGAGTAGEALGNLADIKAHTDLITSATEIAVQSVNDGGVLTIRRYSSASIQITGLGSLAGWEKLWFTLKRSRADDDSEALLQIEESNPGADTDGVTVLIGAAHDTPADGSITVDDAVDGDLTIAWNADVGSVLTAGNLVWDVKRLDATGCEPLTEGNGAITQVVTRDVE